ncbi:lysylphosphatidylglycerol synthase transmembrane domain-containing protein [Nonomuraea sp. 3-1Str]|uniref:lysylphosphatidylglycerol synthase transmembrane domain-containing protein n=1 Tax=unclassified Nonomuraea TaxID=2593643 RepID=UPI00285C3F9C|nr:lysylphosphatidylglycerol synthase transmembrane domain-containing protein [Nonomuraea sp. 3-1Str]MDR8408480.1 flippase-like domain-containing protein [Nonomuraea sp. 3-1Str]
MLRRLLRVVLALVALGFLGYGLARNWDETTTAVARLSPWALPGAFAAVLAGQLCSLLAWRRVLAGLGSPLPLRVAGRIMFVGQLGKYIPGSVWAYAATMELGRDHGSPPRRTFACISLSLVINLGVALSIAAATLATQQVLRQAWYLLLLVPVIIVCLHPKVLTWGLNLALRLARKEPLESVLPGRAVVAAVGWTALGWFVYGIHTWLLVGRWDLYVIATGAYAFAWATGLLAFFVPAGVGVREGAMVLVFTPIIGTGPALAAAVASRLVFTLSDVAAAGVAFLLGRQSASSSEAYADQNGSGSTALTPDRNLSGSPEA